MDMRELELLVPTLFGLEGLCAEELRRLKLQRFVPSQLPHRQLILKISASAYPSFSYMAYSG